MQLLCAGVVIAGFGCGFSVLGIVHLLWEWTREIVFADCHLAAEPPTSLQTIELLHSPMPRALCMLTQLTYFFVVQADALAIGKDSVSLLQPAAGASTRQLPFLSAGGCFCH